MTDATTTTTTTTATRRMLPLVLLVVAAMAHGTAAFSTHPLLPAVSRSSRVGIPRRGTAGLHRPSAPRSSALETPSTEAAGGSLFGNRASSSSSKTAPMGKLATALTKAGMMAFIAGMCLALPITLFPLRLLEKTGRISRVQREQQSLKAGQFCARWLLRLIPFCKLTATPHHDPSPQPSVWVCNHTSALDIFVLLAADRKLRGKAKRPMKIVYWKDLEDNPITRLLFTSCGFIPVQMAANKAGEANDYDLKSFKNLLKQSKQAFEEGFDIGILPEGQLNPDPETSLLPCFPGAFTLARMSKRPIQMMALHGTHRLWHAREDIGMTVTGREVALRVYPNGRKYSSGDEFVATFEAVVGQFATKGTDLSEPELSAWLDGSLWEEHQKQQQADSEDSAS